MYLNLLLVFLLSGIWHGAGYQFIVWGMLHGLLYVVTRFWQKRFRRTDGQSSVIPAGHLFTRVGSRILLFAYVSAAWVYFRAESVGEANAMLLMAIRGPVRKLSLELAECFRMDEFWYVIKVLHLDRMAYSGYILMFAALAACIYLAMIGKNAAQRAEKMKYKTGGAALLGIVFVWCVLTFSKVSTFLYFNF